jgi:hypothetical protein
MNESGICIGETWGTYGAPGAMGRPGWTLSRTGTVPGEARTGRPGRVVRRLISAHNRRHIPKDETQWLPT